MDFRRSGQLDERRRRVLMDEIASPRDADGAGDSQSASGSNAPVRAYSTAVLGELQPHATSLVPVRLRFVMPLALVAVLGVGAIEAVHVQVVRQAVRLPYEAATQLAALNVSTRGGLAAWYSSALLAMAMVWSLVVLGIRVHRLDDYRGHYRIWYWATAAVAWLSIDAATGLHESIGLAMTLLAGNHEFTGTLATDCTTAWMALYGLGLGAIGVRLAIEVWPSLVSFVFLVVAAMLYAGSGLLQMEMFAVADPAAAVVIQSSVTLLAHLSLAAAIGLFARHVFLDAQGRLKVHIDPDKKRPKSKGRAKLKVVKEEGAGNTASEVEQPGRAAAAAVKPSEGLKFGSAASGLKATVSVSKSSLASSEYEDEEEDEDDGDGDSRLSKSERRRLKKLARREAQRRAA